MNERSFKIRVTEVPNKYLESIPETRRAIKVRRVPNKTESEMQWITVLETNGERFRKLV